MDLVASNYGFVLRNVLAAGNTQADDLTNWQHPADPKQLVTQLKAMIPTATNTFRQASPTTRFAPVGSSSHRAPQVALFYSRPQGSTRENYWGTNRIGNRGNDEFFHPQVVAANKFRHAMAGEPENLVFADNGAVVEVERGDKGLSLINFSNEEQALDIATMLPDGTYTDGVSGTTFTAANDRLTGSLAPLTTYILYR